MKRVTITAATKQSERELKRICEDLRKLAYDVEDLSQDAYDEFFQVTDLKVDDLMDNYMMLKEYLKKQPDDFLE